MHQWSPFWRWLAAGVLAAMTIAWLAQTAAHSREGTFGAHQQRVSVQPVRAGVGGPAGCATSDGTAVVVAARNANAAQQVCVSAPGMSVSVNGAGNVAINGSAMTPAQYPAMAVAMQRERGQLQRQEAELQATQAQLNAQTAAQQAHMNAEAAAQQAQLNARMAALQARLNSLGQ